MKKITYCSEICIHVMYQFYKWRLQNTLKFDPFDGNNMKQKEQHVAFHHSYFSYITYGVCYLSTWYRFQAWRLPLLQSQHYLFYIQLIVHIHHSDSSSSGVIISISKGVPSWTADGSKGNYNIIDYRELMHTLIHARLLNTCIFTERLCSESLIKMLLSCKWMTQMQVF